MKLLILCLFVAIAFASDDPKADPKAIVTFGVSVIYYFFSQNFPKNKKKHRKQGSPSSPIVF